MQLAQIPAQIAAQFRGFSQTDTVLGVLLAAFILSRVQVPPSLAGFLDSTLGVAVLLGAVVYLFLYCNPVIGVLALIASYELTRRSAGAGGKRPSVSNYVQFTPSAAETEARMSSEPQPIPLDETLEESIVRRDAPVGQSFLSSYEAPSYAPVASAMPFSAGAF